MDNQQERLYYPYSWHQSHDQATVLVMVPYNVQDDELSVLIDRHHLVITVRGQLPIVKGRLYGTIDVQSSVWQLEPRGTRLPGRERTISSASTASTHSSYALVSDDPDISSSFAASLESGLVSDTDDVVSPSPAMSSPRMVYADELVYPHLPPRRRLNPNPAFSRSVSPRRGAHPSTASSFSSLDSIQAPRSGRLLTVHLEKEQSIIWPSLIIGPTPETLSPNMVNSTVFDSSEELEHKFNMDATSLALMALELADIRKDRDEAFEYFLRSWHQAHVPSATMRLVSHYLPLETAIKVVKGEVKDDVETATKGTEGYWLKCIGGRQGLARLYLEAGLLHLEGAAATLLAASYSSLSSIRMPLQSQIGEGGTEAWKRDREAAGRFFEQASQLDPELDIPNLPEESELELEMPTIHFVPSAPESLHSKESPYDSEPEGPMVRRRRRRPEEGLLSKSTTEFDNLENGPWYLYVPGIVGAGTALLVVGIVGALSFSTWSRRNQGS